MLSKKVHERRRLGVAGEFINVKSFSVTGDTGVLICNHKENGILGVNYANEGTATLHLVFTDKNYSLDFEVEVGADVI